MLIPVNDFIFQLTVCPSIDKPGLREEDDEVESDVYEDPAVLYEGVVENPDPIDLENYLVCLHIIYFHHNVSSLIKQRIVLRPIAPFI